MKEKKIPRWKTGNAKWDAIQVISANRCETSEGGEPVGCKHINSKLVNEIIQSVEETILKSTGARRTKNLSWWNNNCSKAIRARKH